MDLVESIYTHPIFSSLLKNDVSIYGSFIREVLYENVNIDDFFTFSFKPINCYALLTYKSIIERDLYDYIIDIVPVLLSSTDINNTRCDFVSYKLEYNNKIMYMDFSYVKTSLSYYLSYYRSELNLINDIDCIYLDRIGIGCMLVNHLYSNTPIPLYKIIENIKNKQFKIVSKSLLLYNPSLYSYVTYLINYGWENIDNNLIKYSDIEDRTLLENECDICSEDHNINSIQLICKHVFHRKCIKDYIDIYIKDKQYKNTDLKCPYCTHKLDIIELL